MKSNSSPQPGTAGFLLPVTPSKEALDDAIAADGKCNPTRCWHKVAISKLMDTLAPGETHHVRVDAGHIKLNFGGWRYVADTPRHVKRSLMLFDAERYSDLRIRSYKLRFRRTTKIVPHTRKRQEQINAARIKRITAGSEETQKVYNLRARVEGFSGIV